MNPLVSLQEIKEFLVIKPESTADDARLSNIALQVSSLVSSYCGRIFELSNFVEFFDGGTASVFIANPPIYKVNEVSQFTGSAYSILGSPGNNGEPIVIEGSSHSPSIIGAASLTTRVKKFNKSSLKLDGYSYVSIPASDDWYLGEDNFTIETFVRLTSNSNSSYIFTVGSSNSWSIYLDNGIPHFSCTKDSSVVENLYSNNSVLALNNFYHIAAVKNNNNLALYVNGNVVASSNNFIVDIPYNNSIPTIGANLVGYLDNFRITHDAEYLRKFSAPSYSFSATPATKLLIKFDGDNNSTILYDDSRKVNEYVYYNNTGEVSFDVGSGSGNQELGFYNITTSSNFPRGVKVDYQGGFSDVPSDLKLAVLELIKVIHKGRSGSERVSLGGDNSQSFSLSPDDFPPQVRRVLNLYRLLN